MTQLQQCIHYKATYVTYLALGASLIGYVSLAFAEWGLINYDIQHLHLRDSHALKTTLITAFAWLSGYPCLCVYVRVCLLSVRLHIILLVSIRIGQRQFVIDDPPHFDDEVYVSSSATDVNIEQGQQTFQPAAECMNVRGADRDERARKHPALERHWPIILGKGDRTKFHGGPNGVFLFIIRTSCCIYICMYLYISIAKSLKMLQWRRHHLDLWLRFNWCLTRKV